MTKRVIEADTDASRACNELGDGDGLLRLFFHDPMAGVADDGSLDIARDEFQFRLHRRSIRMVTADREDWHAKLPDLRKRRFVLFSISRKGAKLAAKGVVNGARPRIQLGVMASRVLINRRRLRRGARCRKRSSRMRSRPPQGAQRQARES